MASPAAQPLQFFLGISGSQTGPFSEQDVIQQIREGIVPTDALVWYEGLPDWQPITTIEYFKEVFTGGGGSVPQEAHVAEEVPIPEPEPEPEPETPKLEPRTTKRSKTPGGFKPLDEAGDEGESESPRSGRRSSNDDDDVPIQTGGKKRGKRGSGEEDDSSFAAESAGRPVFSDEGSFGAPKKGKSRAVGMLFLLILSTICGGAALYYTGSLDTFLNRDEDTPLVLQKKNAAGGNAQELAGTRDNRARRALSELLLKPEESIAILTGVAKENQTDAIGTEAIKTMVDYYKQRQRNADAGRLLMELKRPKEAADFFLLDVATYGEAEPALFSAYSGSQELSRRDFLLKDIDILLGPLHNPTLASERIQLLAKDFPNERHPYSYYLKTTDQKIADIFQRISFHFVQGLLAHMATEMPQINFISRPVVEIKRDKTGGYRIVGSYRGEVGLSQEKLKDIHFTFWLFDEQWAVVDTNLTIEREKFSRQLRKKHEPEVLPSEKMLSYMENTFKTLFPGSALHETLSADKVATKKPKFE